MTAPEAAPMPPAATGDVAANLERVRAEIAQAARRAGREPGAVRLVAVGKRQPLEKLRAAYDAGQRLFGENYVQEALSKIGALPDDVSWHLIGHLQSNKARQVAGRFACVETVDSLRLVQVLEREARKTGVAQPVLLQVNPTGEPGKAGVTGAAGARELLTAILEGEALQPRGLMTIPDPALDEPGLRAVFAGMARLRAELAAEFRIGDTFSELSMGMSHDFPLAIEEGATLVRVGTAIFGARP